MLKSVSICVSLLIFLTAGFAFADNSNIARQVSMNLKYAPKKCHNEDDTLEYANQIGYIISVVDEDQPPYIDVEKGIVYLKLVVAKTRCMLNPRTNTYHMLAIKPNAGEQAILESSGRLPTTIFTFDLDPDQYGTRVTFPLPIATVATESQHAIYEAGEVARINHLKLFSKAKLPSGIFAKSFGFYNITIDFDKHGNIFP